jgi:dUTP pyrophosphatase
MRVRIKTNSGRVPEYKTPGAVAFDFEAWHDATVEPGQTVLIDTGVVIETPPGYMLMLAPRSSTFKNYGLMLVNSVGYIDQDYSGDADTIKFMYMNMRQNPVHITQGERIGQGAFIRIEKPEFDRVETMGNENRGGFGTTGTH